MKTSCYPVDKADSAKNENSDHNDNSAVLELSEPQNAVLLPTDEQAAASSTSATDEKQS